MTAAHGSTHGTADHLQGLDPNHLADLRKSGLTDETIRAAKIYTETSAERIKLLLNRKGKPPRLGACMVIPFHDANGANGYYRLKPNTPAYDRARERHRKYEAPSKTGSRAYIPPGVHAMLDNADFDLCIVEGEKKALAGTQFGFRTIGISGVWNWKAGGKETFIDDLEAVKWKGRKVFIVFDSDVVEKDNVQEAERRIAATLVNRGAVVKVVRLPDGEPDADGKRPRWGLDDFLVARGGAEFKKLLEAAIDPGPPDADSVKSPGSAIDPADEARKFLDAGKIDGVYRLRFWRGSFWLWRGGRYAEIQGSDVRAYLVRHLNERYFKLSSGATSNIIDQVKAQGHLQPHVEPPAWLGDAPVDWRPADILVTKNGLVHLPSLVGGQDHLRPLTPRLFVQSALDFDFSREATRPTLWLDFLHRLFDDDAESVALLQEWFGYCLAADTSHQKILLLIGPTRSGNGTIARVQKQLVGKINVAGPTLASLSTNFGLSPLVGKTLAIISDARLSGRTDSAVVVERLLSISGEDPLTIDRKYAEPLTMTLPTRLMILSNELPRLGDASGALANRLLVLQLTESWLGREDHQLTSKLSQELPGVLLWAIEGWQRLRERGYFVESPAVADLRAEMHELSSPISTFVAECCTLRPALEVEREDLYDAFRLWSAQQGRKRPDERHVFGRDLRAAYPKLGARQRGTDQDKVRVHVGIDLSDEWRGKLDESREKESAGGKRF